MMKKLFLLMLLMLHFASSNAKADLKDLDQKLRDHTFVYIDKKTGFEHTIYFGRFGQVYDEYFPCEFVDGTWWITSSGTVCLEDSYDKSRRDGKICLKPIIKGGRISFYDSDGQLAFHAKYIQGNGMPFG
ncbi:MAG: hypothetical protein HQM13_06555 [SAR324 cluster bacterium]|nr:hypothetical protein [SAR324 cluster bacterium]